MNELINGNYHPKQLSSLSDGNETFVKIKNIFHIKNNKIFDLLLSTEDSIQPPNKRYPFVILNGSYISIKNSHLFKVTRGYTSDLELNGNETFKIRVSLEKGKIKNVQINDRVEWETFLENGN